MALPARDKRISRRSWLLAGLAIPVFRLRAEEPLAVTFDGDNLHVAAPGLHFLTGKPLAQLKNAATVAFVSQITLFSDDHGTIFRQAVPERLIVSYDLWEEKFAVTIRGVSTRSQSHLTAPEAEAWSLSELAVSALGLAPERPFWLRFDLRASAQKAILNPVGESGISLTSLMIEVLSRRPGPDEPHWTLKAGPLRLADLPRTLGRRTRIF